ncbi:MAG TPA: GAF domain-containing protein [Thermoleophilia bacterium]|nr:GAF domain-containing protein [Thermoleophilia bacterium]
MTDLELRHGDRLRVQDVAGLLGVSANTVRRWTDAGRIPAARSPGGHRRYRLDDLLPLLPAAATAGDAGGPAGSPRAAASADRTVREDGQQAALAATLDLVDLLAREPAELPAAAAEALAGLIRADRCEYIDVRDDHGLVVASYDAGGGADGREGVQVPLDDLLPLQAASPSSPLAVDRATAGSDRRLLSTLTRRGCQSLLWVPVLRDDALVGVLELTCAEPRDLSPHAEIAGAFARLSAQACVASGLRRSLERHEKALAELVVLSQQAAKTHDAEAFAQTLGERLMDAVNADCVDIWRVSGGTVRAVLTMSREGTEPEHAGTTLDLGLYPALGEAMAALEPLVFCDLRDPRLTEKEVDLYGTWGYASSVSVPMIAGGAVVGLIELYDDAERDWHKELEFLTSVAQLVAGLFDNALLVHEVRQREALQHELVELAGALAAVDDIAAIAATAAEHLRRVTGVEDCDVWLLEEGVMRCVVSLDSRGRDAAVEGKRLDLESFPSSAAVVAAQEPLIAATLDDPRIADEERADFAEYGYRSLITLPLVGGAETIGFIDLFDTGERDHEVLRDYLVSAARTIAGALTNAALLAELRARNAALRELVELGDALGETDELPSLSRTVATRLREALSAEDCDIYRVDGDHMTCLASIDGRGWDGTEIGRTLPLADYPPTVAALAANEPIVIGDLDQADLPEKEMSAYRHWGYRSMVSMPLVTEGRPIGLIDVFDTRVRDFAERLDFIRSVGRLLAAAFEEATLLARLEESNRELRLLVNSSLDFSASLDHAAVLSAVAERLIEVTAADMCDVYRIDGDEIEILVSVGGHWDEDPVGQRWKLADYRTFVRALAERRPVITRDILGEPEATEEERSEALRWGYRGTLDVPLLAGGEVVGFLELDSREPHEFPEKDLVMGLAQLAGQAMANAQLYRQLDANARRMTLMAESALELASSLDLEHILQATAHRLCETVGVPNCEIDVVEGDGLRCVMSLADGERVEAWTGSVVPLSLMAVCGGVLERREPAVVTSCDDARLTPEGRRWVESHGYRSWVTLPLVAGDQAVGTVELAETRCDRSFTAEELDAAGAICHVAAVAIRNAQLYESEQAASWETSLLNEIARRTTSSLDVEEIVAGTTDALASVVPYDGYTLALFEDGRVTRVVSSLEDCPLDAADFPAFEGHVLERLRDGRPSVLSLTHGESSEAEHPLLAGYADIVVLPLVADGEVLGTLHLAARRAGSFDATDMELLQRVGTQLSLALKNARLYDEVKRMHLGNLRALSSALNAKDYYTFGHAARVAAYTVMLAGELGWPQETLPRLEEAAYLHDIGKISISDRVLLKAGRLNDEEWRQMRQHPVVSADIIGPLFADDLALGVRHHHERYDGRGYPDGLEGEAIPELARLMAVADAYDAMSCRRPYKAALTYADCLAELKRCRGTQFDPEMTDAFLRVLEKLDRRHLEGERIAAEAAALIDPEWHLPLKTQEDEGSPEYLAITEVLRRVRDAHPPTRYLTTQVALNGRYAIGVDPEEDPAFFSHFGFEIFPDAELPMVLQGKELKTNTVMADAFGVWVTSLAPIRAADGAVVAAVAADLPALDGPEGESLSSDTRQTFATILQDTAERLSRAETDAITDALTGLYNHRHLHECLDEELAQARESGQPLSLLFGDLDHFKAYNDLLGHSAGDAALREVAHLIEQAVRTIDVAARYGGEEFCVLLVGTGAEQALAVGERIRERLERAEIRANGDALTLSIGIATYPDDAESHEALLETADRAMYEAKRQGRNRVVAAGAARLGDSAGDGPRPDATSGAGATGSEAKSGHGPVPGTAEAGSPKAGRAMAGGAKPRAAGAGAAKAGRAARGTAETGGASRRRPRH